VIDMKSLKIVGLVLHLASASTLHSAQATSCDPVLPVGSWQNTVSHPESVDSATVTTWIFEKNNTLTVTTELVDGFGTYYDVKTSFETHYVPELCAFTTVRGISIVRDIRPFEEPMGNLNETIVPANGKISEFLLSASPAADAIILEKKDEPAIRFERLPKP